MHKLLIPVLGALLLIAASSVHAHKIVMSVYESGNMLEGELGFSNGVMSFDQLVEVFDQSGNKLGETKTDEEGYFTYQPTQAVKHVFRADLGAGHIGEAIVEAAEIPGLQVLEKNVAVTPAAVSPTAKAANVDQAAMAEIIRGELRPLRREISAYKEKNDLQTILGGIGYIIGIFGFAMYIAANRKLKEAGK